MSNRVPAWGLPALSALMLCATLSAPACATVFDFTFDTSVNATVRPLRALGSTSVYIDPNAASGKLDGDMHIEIRGFYDTSDVESLGFSNIQTVSAHISEVTASAFGTVLVSVPSIADVVPNLNYPSNPFLMYAGDAGDLVGVDISTTKGGSVVLSYQVNDVYNQYNGVEEDIFSPTTLVASLSSSNTTKYVSLLAGDADYGLDALQVSNLYGTSSSLVSGHANSFGAYTGDSDYYTHGADVANGVSNSGTFDLTARPSGDDTQGSGVPEPASWAMMILGMGAIGFAMRRRYVITRVAYTA